MVGAFELEASSTTHSIPLCAFRFYSASFVCMCSRLTQLLTSYFAMRPCSAFFLIGTAAGDPLQMAPVKVTDTSVDRMVSDCVTWRTSFEEPNGSVSCLTGTHRQAHDSEFQQVLDRVRWGRAGSTTINMINGTWSAMLNGAATKLRIRKNAVQEINALKLSSIAAAPYELKAMDVFLTVNMAQKNEAVATLRAAVDLSLTVKPSAVVMLTRKVGSVPPGTRGLVKEVVCREVLADGRLHRVESVVCEFDGCTVSVGRARFSAFDATGIEVAFCEQVPLLLGWAITVHRAQGLTLDAVEIDFELDTWTTCGMVYTALSRARSMRSLRVHGLRNGLIRVNRFAVAYLNKAMRESGVDVESSGAPPHEPRCC